MRPILYDIFSGAGGATRGYQEAGFEVWGIDIELQPRYCGDRFIRMDAVDFIAACQEGVYGMPDVWHASPPCQVFTSLQGRWGREYPDLVAATRAALRETGRPYVIENVVGAPLENPLMLCGSMFDLRVIRHRLFETDPAIWFPPGQCTHPKGAVGRRGHLGDREWMTVTGHFSDVKKAQHAMGGLTWMTQRELSQAIPPAYTKWLGEQMLAVVRDAQSA